MPTPWDAVRRAAVGGTEKGEPGWLGNEFC